MEIAYQLEEELTYQTSLKIANGAHKEAEKVMSIPLSEWKLENTVEGTDIYSFSEVLVNGMKSKGSVMQTRIKLGKNARDFFRFLTTKEGYCFLDPDANPDDFNKPIAGPFGWTGNGYDSKIQAEYAQLDLKLPFVTKRDYVVMNAHDFSRRRWYCKSIQMPSKYPGCTSYSKDGAKMSGDKIRMAYCVAYSVEDGETRETCYLRVIQWCDMGGKMSFANDGGNKKYLETFIKRAGEKFPAGIKVQPKAEKPSSLLAIVGSLCSKACGSDAPAKTPVADDSDVPAKSMGA